MPGLYAAFLLVSIAGLSVIDYRYRLAFFYRTKQSLVVLAIALATFILWDIAGILSAIFRIGENDLLIGLRVGEFPLEEILFLILLNYTSLITYCLLRRIEK